MEEPGRPTDPAGAEQAVAPPPGHVRFPLFDSLRAIAALSVVIYHAAQVADAESGRGADTWWEAVAARLPIGVTIFFLISGFLLYRPFVAARFGGPPAPQVRDYARRRVLRIVPAFWLALLILIPFNLAWFPGGLFPEGLVIFGFLQSWSHDTFTAGIGVSWTLSVEAAFYVLLPFYAALAARALRGRREGAARIELAVLAALGVASLAFSMAAHDGGEFALAEALPGNFVWFALGMGLAVVSASGSRGRTALTRSAWPLAAAIFLATAAVAGLPGLVESWPEGHTTAEWGLQKALYGLVALLLLLPAVFGAPGVPRRVLAVPALMWVGLVSYGIYLWHGPVIGLLRRHGPDVEGAAQLPAFLVVVVIGVAATIAVAALSFYLVERPILRFKDVRLLSALRRPRAARRFQIAGGPAAPRHARRLLTDAYRWRLPAEELDALRQLVSEVIANSVVHGGVGADGRITFTVRAGRDRIHVDVWDSGRQGAPTLRRPDVSTGDGFGLFLIDRLAAEWGSAHEPALRVWFDIARGAADAPPRRRYARGASSRPAGSAVAEGSASRS